MKLPRFSRRGFLHTGSAGLGLLALAGGPGRTASAADTAAKAASPADKLLADMEAKGRQFLSVPRKDGEFLQLLVKVARARNVLEVGTSQGYSAIWISRGLEETGGKMTTIEIREDRHEVAKRNLAQAGLAHRVTFKLGDAHQLVPTLEGPFDFVFLDADKEGQMDYFSKLYPKKLPPGALLVVHNAIRLGDSMKDFLGMIQGHADFDAVILSLTMDDGFLVSHRHRS